jgi:hypothetical protein
MEDKEKLNDLDINNPDFWKNYKEWQNNLNQKKAEQDIDDTDYREIEEEADDYVLDSWGF